MRDCVVLSIQSVHAVLFVLHSREVSLTCTSFTEQNERQRSRDAAKSSIEDLSNEVESDIKNEMCKRQKS